ncbi:predicted protein [Histoplasma capsulatum var. duboisii H88]|uniref:Predicted protein n=2 Tax=Ajellomyces capsulatus TaxID=5037 RepID=F0U6Y0_AJEC8|nr:predicted protein [Histoplasma capsulatum H143]EGC42351.1 predicted protein [Histoplasma capsulatum var. duboisii H88]
MKQSRHGTILRFMDWDSWSHRAHAFLSKFCTPTYCEDAGHSMMQVSRYPDGPLVVAEDRVDRFPRSIRVIKGAHQNVTSNRCWRRFPGNIMLDIRTESVFHILSRFEQFCCGRFQALSASGVGFLELGKMVPADVLYMYNRSHLPHDYPPRQMNRMTSASVLFSVFDRPTRNTDTGREHVAELKRGWQMLHRIKTREIREPDLVRWSDRVLPRHPISVLQSRTPWEM